MRKVVYIAHPLGALADREQNRQNATMWCAWAAACERVAPVADWIVLSGVFGESDANRAMGLECDVALVRRCDEIWLVGGRISPGMRVELAEAIAANVPVRDLTHLGYLPPEIPT